VLLNAFSSSTSVIPVRLVSPRATLNKPFPTVNGTGEAGSSPVVEVPSLLQVELEPAESTMANLKYPVPV